MSGVSQVSHGLEEKEREREEEKEREIETLKTKVDTKTKRGTFKCCNWMMSPP